MIALWWWIAAIPQRLLDWLDPYAGHEEAIQRTGFARGNDSIRFALSSGREVTDPDEAEALGLTVEARRMRERRCDE